MRIAIGCDHRGLEFKKEVMKQVTKAGHTCEDMGCYTEDSVDYPDIAQKVGETVASGNYDRGILICNTGIGMSIAANKVHGVRAGLCHDAFSATRARLHNDANIMCLGITTDMALIPEIVKAFLTTEFEGGRHQKRLDKVTEMEKV